MRSITMSRSGIAQYARSIGIEILVSLAVILLCQIFLPVEKDIASKEGVAYPNSFIWIHDGTFEQISGSRVRERIKSGDEFIVETILPDNISSQDTFWYDSCHQNVRIYIKDAEAYGNSDNGTLIFEYDVSGHWYSGNNSPSKFVSFPLDPAFSGHVMRIVTTSRSYFSGFFMQPYIGKYGEVMDYVAGTRIVALIMAMVLLMVGIIIVICCMMIGRVVNERFVYTTFLGYACLCTGGWILFETRFRQFIFSNVSFISNMAYICMALMSGTIILYMNELTEYRHKKLYLCFSLFLGTVTSGLSILHLTRIADFTQTMMVSYGLYPLLVSGVFITSLSDYIQKKSEKYRISTMGFFILCIFSICELYADVILYNDNTGVFIGSGMLIFAFMSIFNTFEVIIDAEKDKNRAVIEGEAKSKFLANMSHEIRTPINSVLGMNEMIMRESQEKSTLEYAGHIESSGRLLLSIVNEILDFSKIEAGKMDICPVEYHLSSVLNDLVNTLSPKADEKGLRFEINIDESIPDKLKGDEVRIRQIVINLVNNAIKYTHEGSVSLIVKGIYDIPGSLNLVIEVTDTGTGIKEQDMQKLFEAFKRVDEEHNSHIEGTGLGLSITESLVELMGGSISVQSKYGFGSIFVVQIPQTIIDRDPIGDFKKRAGLARDNRQQYQESFTAPGAAVLVVDDNPSNLTVVKLLLKKTAMFVDTVDSGAKAIEMLKIRDYDIVMLDHMMPEMDGFETLKRVRELYPDKKYPVIALTANAVSGAREQYLEAGFDDYMSKPIMGDALEKMMLTWLPENKVKRKSDQEDTTPGYRIIADLPPIDRINWLDAAEYLPEMDILMETLASVVKGMPDLADDVEKYFDELRDDNNEESMNNYRIKVHAMKSSSKMIGAGALSEEAKAMEYAAKDGEYEKIMGGTMHLLMEWRALYKDLDELLQNREE